VGASAIPETARRGRPLSERTENAILEATAALLDEKGLSEITMEEIAATAGVGKASLYRRWPSKGTLAFDAFGARFLGRQPLVDTGSLRGDLTAALRAWLRTVHNTRTGRTLRGLIAEVQRDDALASAWNERFLTPVRARHRVMIERAVARGELPQDADSDLLLDLAYGPLYHRLLHGHRPLTVGFVDDVVASVMAAGRAGRAG